MAVLGLCLRPGAREALCLALEEAKTPRGLCLPVSGPGPQRKLTQGEDAAIQLRAVCVCFEIVAMASCPTEGRAEFYTSVRSRSCRARMSCGAQRKHVRRFASSCAPPGRARQMAVLLFGPARCGWASLRCHVLTFLSLPLLQAAASQAAPSSFINDVVEPREGSAEGFHRGAAETPQESPCRSPSAPRIRCCRRHQKRSQQRRLRHRVCTACPSFAWPILHELLG